MNMAVFKEGAEYHIYDYDSGKISRSLTSQEVNKVLRDVRQGTVSQTSEVVENTTQTAEKRLALSDEKQYNRNAQFTNNGFTENEEGSLLAYKSGGSYSLNAKLRDGAKLNEYEQDIVDNLDRALEKLPVYKGEVYRIILFDGFGDKAARDAYVKSHVVGERIIYEAYTSTSSKNDGYPSYGEYVVRHIIQSINGRDMTGHGNNFENEVLFARDSIYLTDRIEYDQDGTPTIYLTEVANEQQAAEAQTTHGRGVQRDVSRNNPGESRTRTHTSEKAEVQRLPIQHPEDGKLQLAVSERNSEGDLGKQEGLRGVQTEVREANADLDGYARENIKDYDKLSAPNQAEIRAMIREGRALGMSDGDVLLYAKISARTGVRVTFDKGKTLIGRRKGTRELVYADGFYDPATNEICVNPDGKRSADKLLIHELAHAIYGGEKGMRLAKRNVKNLSAEEKKAISDRYAEVDRTDEIELLDEYNAHYAEGILGNAETLERLLDDAPTVKDRILDFLRGAKGDTDAQRSAAARRLFYRYKRLFDRFAQQNAQNIAAERLPTVATDTEKKTPHGEAPEASGVTNTQELSVKRKDAAYLDAVSRGDVEAAQRMVDEAADKAGYTVDAYHGTDADFTVFDKNSVGKGADEYGAGFYFAKQRAYSSEFGKNVYKVRLKIENPIKLHRTPGGGGTLYDVKITPEQAYKILKKHPMMFDKTDSPLAGRFDEYRKVGAKKWMVRELATSYKSLGVLCDKYFGIFKDYPNEFHEAVRDVLGYDGVEVYNDPEVRSLESGDYFYVAWFDDQMKSADPIVRDDNGNVIPLSERFNEKKNDIRYALPYDDAIDQLVNDTLNTTQNTHLRVLDHTPQIYIEKAGASNREIVMSWDIAYLALKKDGDLQGNYHGLGTDVMKALPRALEDPLYIVKQKNGRIAAVTRIVVKGKRAVFASIELEAFQTTIQEGTTESKKYNLVVTVTDAKPNYLQNTIFGGEIVHNKNSEDPAHFILRLKSLEKATPTYDLAGSSKDSIPDSEEKVNRNSENSSKKRLALPDMDGSVDIYTEEEYNNFGWARDAEAISVKELDDLYSKIQEKGTLRRFKQSASGEAIVEVNNKPRTTLDVDNVFVFVKGTKSFPEITRVLRVSLFSETDMEKVRKFIYDNEKYPNARTGIASRGIFFEEGLISEYSRRNCQNYQEYRSQIRQRSGRSEGTGDPGAYRNGDFGSGASEKTNGNIKFALPVDSDKETIPSSVLTKQAVPHTDKGRANYWKDKAKENESRAKVLGNISALAQRMKDLKLGTYHNATQDQSKQFAGSVEGISRIVWNGNLSVKLARKHIGTLRAWYKQDNPILCYQDKENPGYYNAEIAEMLAGIADGEGGEENFFGKILRKTEIHLDKRSVLWYNNNRDAGLKIAYVLARAPRAYAIPQKSAGASRNPPIFHRVGFGRFLRFLHSRNFFEIFSEELELI